MPRATWIALTELKPESTYNIILEYPGRRTTVVLKFEKAIRPGFTYVNLPCAKYSLKTMEDVARTPTSSLTVTATTP